MKKLLMVLMLSICSTGVQAVEIRFGDFNRQGNAYAYVDGKEGYFDKSGNWVIPPTYDSASEFYEGLASVSINGIYGYVNTSGQMALVPFERASDFQEELAAVKDKYVGKWGYINHHGEFVIQTQFDEADSFSGGLALVKIGNKYGFIDKSGSWVIKPTFDSGHAFYDGLAIVRVKGKWGCVNQVGKFVIEPQFDRFGYFNEGLAVVESNDKSGYINKTGKFVIKPTFSSMPGEFKEGLATVKANDKWKFGSIDKTGKQVIPPQFDGQYYFEDGLAGVLFNGHYGFINKLGQFVIEAKFEDGAGGFSDGLASAKYNGKWGYINKTGQFVIEPKFEHASRFYNGLALVEVNGKSGYIDEKGAWAISPDKLEESVTKYLNK
jgi:predicted DNA-binding WGR domain protein